MAHYERNLGVNGIDIPRPNDEAGYLKCSTVGHEFSFVDRSTLQ
jgi:hypothetical protein